MRMPNEACRNERKLMWMCSQSATSSIHLCGEHSLYNQTLCIWSRYFKEKYIRNAGCTFNEANVKQTTFWHSFRFVSVPLCVVNIRCTTKRYPFGVGTSKKNTFAMLGVHLTRQMSNKLLFGIRLDSSQFYMPHSHLRTDVDFL